MSRWWHIAIAILAHICNFFHSKTPPLLRRLLFSWLGGSSGLWARLYGLVGRRCFFLGELPASRRHKSRGPALTGRRWCMTSDSTRAALPSAQIRCKTLKGYHYFSFGTVIRSSSRRLESDVARWFILQAQKLEGSYESLGGIPPKKPKTF